MRGRTNIGSGGVTEIFADTENFTVAEGSTVTAGNFVQYKLEPNDKKYDTNAGYERTFYNSGNEAPKVLPCGNNKYVRRYKNDGETNIFWFNLIDVSNGFRVLSAFSIYSTNLPSFCLLHDGNIAICYMEEENTFTIRIYNIESAFLLLNTFKLTNENIGETDITHITQLGDLRIVVNKMNQCLVCNYELGNIAENQYIDLGISLTFEGRKWLLSQSGDNDWNLYGIEESKIIIFPKFYYSSTYRYSIFLIQIGDGNSTILYQIENYEKGYSGNLNCALWGNAFGINGKILFSKGTPNGESSDVNYINTYDYYQTKIYSVQNNYIVQSSDTNLFGLTRNSFEDLNSDGNAKYPAKESSGSAQYVKENVFYVAVTPKIMYRSGNTAYSVDSNSRTAIYRMEYNPNSGTFLQSNIVTFEGEFNDYKFGFGQFFESEEGVVYYLYETQTSTDHAKTGRWLMKLTYKNGILEIGESTGMVENYNGSGAAIGVAKQSGTVGKVVEVYVPKV